MQSIRSLRLRPLLFAIPSLLVCALLLTGANSANEHTSAADTLTHTLTVATASPTSASAWPNDGATDHPVASTGCSRTPPIAAGGTAQQSVAVNPATNQGFTTRAYWIHVPKGYNPSQPVPLALAFHGGGGKASGLVGSGLTLLADQKGFIAVYPQGLPFGAPGSSYTTWAATGPLDSLSNGTDDLLFISTLLDSIQQRYCVDPRRIYATGFSAGGAMTAFLTCGLTGRIAAFAPFSGDAYQFLGGCFPHHPTSIIEFHGAADPHELYVGIPAREDPDWRRTGVIEWLTTWAARDRCAGGPQVFINDGSVLAEQWAGCPNGVALVHYRIAGLGHAFPPPIGGRSAYAIMWDFFVAHPLQSA